MVEDNQGKNYVMHFTLQLGDQEKNIYFLTTPTYFSFKEVYTESSLSMDASLEEQPEKIFHFYYQCKVSELMKGVDGNSAWVENAYEGTLVLPIGKSTILYQSGHRQLTVRLIEDAREK
jgi:hypothetical protein